ncbi:MAG: hypothetical protein AABO58_14275 [Acidobacteriota bacterium]
MGDNDPLRELLRRKAREIGDEAAKHDGVVPPDQLDALNHLARLVEVREKAFPSISPRWRIAAVLAGTLVLVSLLLFLRVRETEVELQLAVSEAGFVLSRPQVLTDTVNLAELGVSGLRGIQSSDSALSQWAAQSGPDEQKAVRVTATERDQRTGTVTLHPLNLAAGVEVHVGEGRTPLSARVVLKGSRNVMRATLYGPLKIDLMSAESREAVFEIPRSFLLETDPGEASLDLLFAAGSDTEFSPQLSIKKLSLSRIDEFQASDGTTTDAVSTILSGTIYLESLNGEPRPVRPRELLRFDEVRGVIRTLQLEKGHVTLAFRGTVRGMRSGWGENPKSLMPTWLAWLQARHRMPLLWGTTLYVFGLIAAVLRWWRVRL